MTGRSRLRALTAAIAGGAALVAVLAGGVSSASATTPSAMLRGFDAGDIISDQVMFNASTMTQAQVQSFLNSEVSTCQNVQYATGLPCLKDYRQTTQSRPADPMCHAYTGASNETAAAIIVKVGKACSLNPQVLLVLLQKEQGLVTDSWPTSSQYRKATGYGCPDSTSVCDATYNGFYNQVYKAAWAFQRYTMPKGTGPGTEYYSVYSAYPVGKAYPILYQDPYTDSSCGSKSVVVKNKATHSLYYYTPYTPNSAALAAGFGSGDACSAYGNRNFFLYFTQWFGSTHITVSGAIGAYWTSHGGASGALGAATGNAVTSTKNGGGTTQAFQHGTVFSSKAGTFVITGALLTEYTRRGGVGGTLQWPVADQDTVVVNGGGLMQQFGSGELYSSPAGTYAVRGDLRTAYLAQGGVTGPLGFPTDTASTLATGWVQHFTKGTTYFNTATGGFGVPSAVDKGFTARKGPSGALGWPVAMAGSRTAAGIRGTVERFEQGELYVSSAGTAAVMSPVGTALAASPADTLSDVDALGWPTADATTTTVSGGGSVQVFTGGRRYVPNGKAAATVTGPILSSYVAAGEAAGSLGWPLASARVVSAHGSTGTVQAFQSGSAYLQGSTVRTVTGELYSAYVNQDGPTGALGWATGPALQTTASGGGWTQAFGGGTEYYSSASQQTFAVAGTVLKLYSARGEAGSSLGWPTGQAGTVSVNGVSRTVQTFQGGSVYATGATANSVTGGLYRAYAADGGPAGSLGWVTGPAVHTSVSGGGWTQPFSLGVEYFSTTAGSAYPVTGAMLSLYRQRGEAGGSLGWPASSATAVSAHGATNTVQTFQRGSFTQSGPTVRIVNGGLYRAYAAAGGPAGDVGWVTGPATHTAVAGGGWTQTFTGAEIYYSSTTRDAYPVSGSILSLYHARREASSSLGWPSGSASAVTADGDAGSVQDFQGGSVYVSGSGTQSVTISLYGEYLAEGGPTGALGWVTGPAVPSKADGGGWTQTFAHGTLFYSSITRRSHPVTGAVLAAYTHLGGPASRLGWPLAAAVVTGSTTTQSFRHGTITEQGGTVTIG